MFGVQFHVGFPGWGSGRKFMNFSAIMLEKMDFSHCYSDFTMKFMSRTKNGNVPPRPLVDASMFFFWDL